MSHPLAHESIAKESKTIITLDYVTKRSILKEGKKLKEGSIINEIEIS